MIYLLLFISFFIHFLLFRVIIQLKNKVEAYENGAVPTTKDQEERLEQRLTSFLQEMKQENEQFIAQVEALSKEQRPRAPLQMEQETVQMPTQGVKQVKKEESADRDRPIEPRKETEASIASPQPKQPNDSSFQSILEASIASEETAFESSKEANILHLHSQGNTVEEIAKKLDIGKTEVELIVKIQQNQRK